MTVSASVMPNEEEPLAQHHQQQQHNDSYADEYLNPFNQMNDVMVSSNVDDIIIDDDDVYAEIPAQLPPMAPSPLARMNRDSSQMLRYSQNNLKRGNPRVPSGYQSASFVQKQRNAGV